MLGIGTITIILANNLVESVIFLNAYLLIQICSVPSMILHTLDITIFGPLFLDQNLDDLLYPEQILLLFLLLLVLCPGVSPGMPFFPISAYQSPSLKCTCVMISRHYFCHPAGCNAFFFELFLWSTLQSSTHIRVIYKSHFSL